MTKEDYLRSQGLTAVDIGSVNALKKAIKKKKPHYKLGGMKKAQLNHIFKKIKWEKQNEPKDTISSVRLSANFAD